MAKKFDHHEATSKARGRRDHDYKKAAEKRQLSVKAEAEQVARRAAAGRPNKSKTARLSGPVTHIVGEEAAEIAARYGVKFSPSKPRK